MQMNEIECAGFIEESCDDGPGFRSVLFLQGCSKNCKDCHNSAIKNHGEGTVVELGTLIDYIDRNCGNKKITISGGEPFEQKESLLALVRMLKGMDYNICIYTGWDYENVPKEIWKYVDYVKTGGFVSSLHDENIQYVGSSNQHMYKYVNGRIEELDLTIE